MLIIFCMVSIAFPHTCFLIIERISPIVIINVIRIIVVKIITGSVAINYPAFAMGNHPCSDNRCIFVLVIII